MNKRDTSLQTPDSWLRRGGLVDEGPKTAVYPYIGLENILKPEDSRNAVLDETESLEQEFGRLLIEPLYGLLWILNTGQGVCTSHTAISPADHKPPFAWARHCLGVDIITIPRKVSEQHRLRVAEEMVRELGFLLASSKLLGHQDTAGWFVTLKPCRLSVEYQVAGGAKEIPAYGCEMIIMGCASSRRKACERWSRAITFVRDTLQELQNRNGVPAPPFDHFAHFFDTPWNPANG